jgi:hypothetical protein
MDHREICCKEIKWVILDWRIYLFIYTVAYGSSGCVAPNAGLLLNNELGIVLKKLVVA